MGKYPAWMPCRPERTNGTELKCGGHAPDGTLTGFHPYETCATMHNGWFTKGTGVGGTNTFWSPSAIWDHYMYSVGIGYINTLNAPPGTTGQIPEALVKSMTTFGTALRSLLKPVAEDAVAQQRKLTCSNDSSATAASIVLDLGAPVTFNSIITAEDLRAGQKVKMYSVEYMAANGTWTAFPTCGAGNQCVPGASPAPAPGGGKIPPTPEGSCGGKMTGVNFVSGLGPGVKFVGKVPTSSACEDLCSKDEKCNFWTWHDDAVQPSSFKDKCYLREDSDYNFKKETDHVSGVCNHTLFPGGGEGSNSAIGVRGKSIGFKLIDWVPETTASKVRLRCTGSMAADSSALISSFSLHHAQRLGPTRRNEPKTVCYSAKL